MRWCLSASAVAAWCAGNAGLRLLRVARPVAAVAVSSSVAVLYASAVEPHPPVQRPDAADPHAQAEVDDLAAAIVRDTASILGKSPSALKSRLRLYFSLLSGGKDEFPASKLKNDVVVFALSGGLGVDLATVFDRDASGTISYPEFVYGMCIVQLLFHLEHSPEVEQQLGHLMFELIDEDGDGVVTRAELVSWLRAAVSLGLVPECWMADNADVDVIADRMLSEVDAADGLVNFKSFLTLNDKLVYSAFWHLHSPHETMPHVVRRV